MDRKRDPVLEQLSHRAMPGLRRQTLGDWIMRAALGETGRANSTWATGSPSVPIVEAVDRVEAWYLEQGLIPQFQLFSKGESELGTELDRRAYRTGSGGLTMVGSVEEVLVRTGKPPECDLSFESSSCCPTSFEDLIGDPDRREELGATELEQGWVVARNSLGAMLGGGIATNDGGWVGLSGLSTVAGARRQGVGTGVVREMMRQAGERGARSVWLQVHPDNEVAVSLYRGLGMESQGSFIYRAAAALASK